ncbi:MAG TPA: hypothetical protein VK509_18040 [Polyangiales bacterium]|nr:hypothetical protein [Polyangiales bacterium]
MPRTLLVTFVCAVLLAACGDDGDGDNEGDDGGRDSGPAKPRLTVEIGTPSPKGDLGFVALEEGGDIPLNTFGQGGTHAELAVRAIGFGNKAFVDLTLENLDSGATVGSLPSSRPQLLICRETPKGACDMLPFYVMTGGLAEPSQKDGLRIRVIADVHTEDGEEASTSREGVLRKVF